MQMPNHLNEFIPRRKPTLAGMFQIKSWFRNDQMDRICTIFLTVLVVIAIFLMFLLRNMNFLPKVPIKNEPIN